MAELDKGSIFEVGTGEQWWSGKGGPLSSKSLWPYSVRTSDIFLVRPG